MTIEQQIAALWDGLGSRWKYIAIDGNGDICAYTHPPEKSGSVWEPGPGFYRPLQKVQFDEVYTRPEPQAEDDLAIWYERKLEHDAICAKERSRLAALEAQAYTAEQLREMAKQVWDSASEKDSADELLKIYTLSQGILNCAKYLQKQQP